MAKSMNKLVKIYWLILIGLTLSAEPRKIDQRIDEKGAVDSTEDELQDIEEQGFNLDKKTLETIENDVLDELKENFGMEHDLSSHNESEGAADMEEEEEDQTDFGEERIGHGIASQDYFKRSMPSWEANGHVCFSAKGNRPGTIHVNKEGILLGIKLVHTHGYVTCNYRVRHSYENWGCGSFINILITDSRNVQIFPDSSKITMDHLGFYIYPGYSTRSKVIAFTNFCNPLYVHKGKSLKVWMGEDLRDKAEGDNAGTSCANVFIQYA